MTFGEYFGEFTHQGIVYQIDKDHKHRMLPTQYVERLHLLLKSCQIAPILPEDTSIISTTQLNQILLYSLYKMDRQNYYLKKGQRNITLQAADILALVADDDIQMRSFATVDLRREYVTIGVITAILYCYVMQKKVEMQTLLNLSADLRYASLEHAYRTAQDMLNDCRHFSKNQYDSKVLMFLNQAPGPIKKSTRAF